MKNELYKKSIIPFFVVLITIMALFQFKDVRYTTADDVVQYLAVKEGTFSPIDTAKDEGRFNWVFHLFPYKIIYLIDNKIYYNVCNMISIILCMFLFCYSLYKIFNDKLICVLSLILVWAFLENNTFHWPISAYPMIFQIGLSFFWISLALYSNYIENKKSLYAIGASIAYLCSLLMYENFVIFFLAFPLILGLKEQKVDFKKLRLLLSPFIPLFIYLVMYFSFRAYYPSEYEGNQIKLGSIKNILSVIWQYSISAFPGYFYFGKHFNEFSFFRDFLKLLQEMRVEWLVKAFLVFFAIYIVIKEKYVTSMSKKNIAIGLMLSVFLIFAPNILLSITSKYQKWVTGGWSPAYITTYFSYFGVILFISLICYSMVRFTKVKSIQNILIVIIGIGASYFSIITDYHKYHITNEQIVSQTAWQLMDKFLASPVFEEVESGSTIYAPSLYRAIDQYSLLHPWEPWDNRYWSMYTKIKTDKDVEISPSIAQRGQKNSASYFLLINQEIHKDNSYLLFAKTDNSISMTKKISLFSYSKNRNILLNVSLKGAGDLIVNGKNITTRDGPKKNYVAYINLHEAEDLPYYEIESRSSYIDLLFFRVSYSENEISHVYFK